jgi:CubicO group peptidase (beta-lactamase class C family)
MLKAVRPEQAGFSTTRLGRVNTLMERYVAEKRLSGIIATMARRGQTVYLDKFGLADVETGKPMQFDTIFHIMSMTKPVTSVAAMMLYEEGWFDLNTPISEFIPAFRNAKVFVKNTADGPEMAPLDRPITFRHLFTHTSGLSYGWDPNDPVDRLYQEVRGHADKGGAPMTNAILAEGLATLPLAFQPGTHWRYSLAIDVLGRLVEVISGQALDVFFQERIFGPLQMPDTAFFVPQAKAPRLAKVYKTPASGMGLTPVDIDVCYELPSFLSGGGGLVSTLGDYARFAQMLVNGGEMDGVRLLGPHTVALMEMNQAPAEALPYAFNPSDPNHLGYGYGLGMRVLIDVAASGVAGTAGEFGWDGAFSTYFWIDRKEALYGLMMLHHENCQFPIKRQFKALTYQALID